MNAWISTKVVLKKWGPWNHIWHFQLPKFYTIYKLIYIPFSRYGKSTLLVNASLNIKHKGQSYLISNIFLSWCEDFWVFSCFYILGFFLYTIKFENYFQFVIPIHLSHYIILWLFLIAPSLSFTGSYSCSKQSLSLLLLTYKTEEVSGDRSTVPSRRTSPSSSCAPSPCCSPPVASSPPASASLKIRKVYPCI